MKGRQYDVVLGVRELTFSCGGLASLTTPSLTHHRLTGITTFLLKPYTIFHITTIHHITTSLITGYQASLHHISHYNHTSYYNITNSSHITGRNKPTLLELT